MPHAGTKSSHAATKTWQFFFFNENCNVCTASKLYWFLPSLRNMPQTLVLNQPLTFWIQLKIHLFCKAPTSSSLPSLSMDTMSAPPLSSHMSCGNFSSSPVPAQGPDTFILPNTPPSTQQIWEQRSGSVDQLTVPAWQCSYERMSLFSSASVSCIPGFPHHFLLCFFIFLYNFGVVLFPEDHSTF